MEDLLALIHTLHLAREEAYGMRMRTVIKAVDQERNFTPMEKNFLNELDGKIDKLDRQLAAAKRELDQLTRPSTLSRWFWR